MNEIDNIIIGFQYWDQAGKYQRGSWYAEEALEKGRAAHDEYMAQGNTIAAWWEGSIKEAKKQFPDLF